MADSIIRDQPSPTPVVGGESIQSLVRDDLLKREQLGIERYGTSLQAGNGRNPLVDGYQEALDLACYLRQAIAEGGFVGRHGADDTLRSPASEMTPGQFLAMILDGSTERRLDIAGKILADCRVSSQCFREDHVGTIEELRKQIGTLSRALIKATSGLPISPDSDVMFYAKSNAKVGEDTNG